MLEHNKHMCFAPFTDKKYSCRMQNSVLMIVSNSPYACEEMSRALGENFSLVSLTIEKFSQGRILPVNGIIVDADLTNYNVSTSVERGLSHVDRTGTFVVFITDPYREGDLIQAMRMDADTVISRITTSVLNGGASHEAQAVANIAKTDFLESARRTVDWLLLKYQQPRTLLKAIGAGEKAISAVFELAKYGKPPEPALLQKNTEAVLEGISEHGLRSWIKMVKSHHDATYRHCLIVTGVATAFGQSLGFSAKDIDRISVSGMLHDIGKAVTPVAILEKPEDKLTADEAKIFKQHTILGREIVSNNVGYGTEVLDVISDHHEYLDGSGYPKGIDGDSISDLTRLMTIADVYGQLIEGYGGKQSLSSTQSFGVLASMGGQLDVPLVKAFKKVSMSMLPKL